MTIKGYLDTIGIRYKNGISREHSYRGDLQALLMTILPDILVTNEPARVAFGAPDYMLTRKDVPIGFNGTQFFDGVPKIACEFYIGGYQPAQKWLKDRKGRILNFEDVLHYQKIIAALARTVEIMKEIDRVANIN